MSSSTSLIGRPALARRVLVELVEDEEDERPRWPVVSFCSNSRLTTTPTTKRFARSCRLWMSMTETWRASQSIRCAPGPAASAARDQVAAVETRCTRAGAGTRETVPGDRVAPTRSDVVEDESPSISSQSSSKSADRAGRVAVMAGQA